MGEIPPRSQQREMNDQGGERDVEQHSVMFDGYKIPSAIEVHEKEGSVSIRSNAGEFYMPIDMFKMYINTFTVLPEDFPYVISRYIREDEYDHNPRTIAMRTRIREFMVSQGMRPEDYLSQYGEKNEKTIELMTILPKEILDEVMFERLQFHFQSGDGKINYFEHRSIGGSATEFFGHPFVGGFKADGEWQKQTRAQREEFLKAPARLSAQALILFTNRKEYDYSGPEQYYDHTEADSKELGEQVRKKLRALYESGDEPALPFAKIDYARVVLKPVPYDENMEAIPEPVRLEFLSGKQVIMTIDDPKLLQEFRPAHQDFELAGILKDVVGEKHYLRMKTKGATHILSFADGKIPDWYNSYLQRISKE